MTSFALIIALVTPPQYVTFSDGMGFFPDAGTYRIMAGATITLPSGSRFELQRVAPNRFVGELRLTDGSRMQYQKTIPATNGYMLSLPYRLPPADPINGPPMIEWIAGSNPPSVWPGVLLQ